MATWTKGFVTARGGYMNKKTCLECSSIEPLYPSNLEVKKEIAGDELSKLKPQIEDKKGGLLPNLDQEVFGRRYKDDNFLPLLYFIHNII